MKLRPVALLAFLGLSFVGMGLLVSRPAPVQAEFQAAAVSTDLVFQCRPDGTLITGFGWRSAGVGPQWFDLSRWNNEFASRTYISAGPLPAEQSGLMWEGLEIATVYFVRVTTLAADSWTASDTMFFQTPDDCHSSITLELPTSAPGCIELSRESLSGCVWTARPDYSSYAVGEIVTYCYALNGPADIRIEVDKPDTSFVVIEGFVSTGACLGPFEANTPRGLRHVRMFGGPRERLLAETHFYVE